MQSFSRGWSFLKQAWQMAAKDKDLIKPSIMALFAGFIVSLIFIPLMVGAGFLTGGDNSLVGQIILFVLGGVMIFIQYTVGYIFSAMTVYLIYGYLAEGDGVMSKAFALASGSNLVVSGDRHLLKVSGYQNIEVMKPREFLDKHL